MGDQNSQAVLATKEQLFDLAKPVIKLVEVEVNGEKRQVHLALMSGLQLEEWEDYVAANTQAGGGVKGLRTKFVSMTLVTAEGQPMMVQEEVGELPKNLVIELFDHAMRLNKVSEAAQADAKKE